MNVAQQVKTHSQDLSHLFEAASALAGLTTSPSPTTTGARPTSEDAVVSDDEGAKKRSSASASSVTTVPTSKREIFPQRLMAILNDPTLSDIISWLPHGRAFVIIRPDVLTGTVLPKYLPPVDARSSTKYPSFTRKLNRWGFRQATRGPDTGAFHHPLFLRDKPELSLQMVCQRSRDKRSNIKKQDDIDSKKVQVPLTKEALAAVASQSMPAPAAAVAVSVSSDDCQSESGTASLDVASAAPSLTSTRGIQASITSDMSFYQEQVRRRDELERMRLAKLALRQSFMRALHGNQK